MAIMPIINSGSINTQLDNLNSIHSNTFEPTGFNLPQDFVHNATYYVNLSFTNAIRTFSISPVNTDYQFYSKGVLYTKTQAETVQITDTDGIHFIYFDSDGTLKSSESLEFFKDGHVAVSYIYWNVAEQKSILFGLEMHGSVMPWSCHLYDHESNGTKYINGLLAGNYTLVGDGSSNTHAQLSISNGQIDDEDLRYFITHSATPTNFGEQKLSTIAEIPVMYRNGVGGVWTIDNATQYPVKQGTARIKYNLNTAGTWTTPDVDANDKYIAMWVFATNNKTPIVAVLGQRVDASLNDAKTNNTYSSIDFGNMPFVEFKSLWRLIFKTNSAYTNTPKAILQDVESLLNINAIQISTINTADHNTLTNRNATGSHPASAISFNNIASGYTSTQTQDAIDEVITRTANKVNGAILGNFAALNNVGDLFDSGNKDADYVHSTGDETIAGLKTFSTTPKVPVTAPTLSTEVTNKKYVDDGLSSKEPTITKGNITTTTNGLSIGGSSTNSVIGTGVTINVQNANTSQNGLLTSADWNTFNGKQSSLGFTAEDSANKSTSTSLGTSNTLYPTQGAVKSYVDNGLSGKESTVTKGNLTGTNISVVGGTGAVIGSGVTISIPQSVATTANPTFANITSTAHFYVSIGTTTIGSGTINDLVIPDTDVVFITSSTGNATISGIAGGVSGRMLRIIYTGANNITFSNQNSGSIAINRFNTLGSNFVTNGPGSVNFLHDGNSWYLLGGVT